MTVVQLSKLIITSCILMILVGVVSSAKNSAPAPAADCSSLVLNMADCLSYVTAGGTARTPEETCCSGLKMVLKTDVECLCEAFRNSAQLGVTLNMTKALALPSACRVSAPSVTNCGLNIGDGAAPVAALSPLATSPSSIADSPTANIGANDVAPLSAPSSSHSDSALASASFFIISRCVFCFILSGLPF